MVQPLVTWSVEVVCAPVVHSVMSKRIIPYKDLDNDPVRRSLWTTGYRKEYGWMAQGDKKTGTKGKYCIFVMNHEDIVNIPKDHVITYAKVMVFYFNAKKRPISSTNHGGKKFDQMSRQIKYKNSTSDHFKALLAQRHKHGRSRICSAWCWSFLSRNAIKKVQIDALTPETFLTIHY